MEIGELIEGKYRITRLIGEGGMGAVYLGENVRISRRVAIKVLHAALTDNKEVTQRFEREAQAAGRIGNDHILEMLDFGTLPNGEHYIVMEYLDGEPLTARIKERGRVPALELAELMRQVLVGLAAAHRAGIIHRDLKPDNIFILKEKVGKSDFCKIIDFGISKFQSANNESMRMTRTGMLMGTPYYMSPEQASGRTEADHRADLYAVGVMMFEAATSQVPFRATTFNQLLFKIVLDDVPRPEAVNPELDLAFASLISKAMARDVNQRFQTAEEFIHAIDAWLAQGTAVPLPPSVDASATFLLKEPPSELPPEQKAANSGSWDTSEVDAIPGRKSNVGIVVALGALLLAAIAGAVIALRSGNEEAAPAPPEAAVDKPPSAPASPTHEAAPSVAPLAPVEAAAPSASVAGRVAPRFRLRPPTSKAPASAKPTSISRPAATGKSSRDFGY